MNLFTHDTAWLCHGQRKGIQMHRDSRNIRAAIEAEGWRITYGELPGHRQSLVMVDGWRRQVVIQERALDLLPYRLRSAHLTHALAVALGHVRLNLAHLLAGDRSAEVQTAAHEFARALLLPPDELRRHPLTQALKDAPSLRRRRKALRRLARAFNVPGKVLRRALAAGSSSPEMPS